MKITLVAVLVPLSICGSVSCGPNAPPAGSSFPETSFIPTRINKGTDLIAYAAKIPIGATAREVEFLLGQPHHLSNAPTKDKGISTWGYRRGNESEDNTGGQHLLLSFQDYRLDSIRLTIPQENPETDSGSPRESISYVRRNNLKLVGGLEKAQSLIHKDQDSKSVIKLLGEPDIVMGTTDFVDYAIGEKYLEKGEWQYRMWVGGSAQVLGSLVVLIEGGRVQSTNLILPKLK